MTTIVYRDGVIAYDSRVTRGDTVIDDGCEKMSVVNDVHFFWAGSGPDAEHLINAYFGKPSSNRLQVAAIAYDPATNELWSLGQTEDGFWRDRIMLDRPYAIGSGTPHALTAIDMGASAETAVEMAAKRDLYTGGAVRKFFIPTSNT